jgi:uncharacterized protein (TIGR02217 family)
MYIPLRLPVCLSFGSGGGPTFRTDIAETASGVESRNQVWEYERLEYSCHYDATLDVQFEEMHAFFRIMAGMANTFRARDPLNYRAAAGEGFFVDSLGSPVGKQMVKRVSIGAYSADLIVTKPVNGTITITGGGTLNYDTGVVDGGSPTAWEGDFDIHVRFDTDSIRPQIINKQHASGGFIVAWEPLPIIEVKQE